MQMFRVSSMSYVLIEGQRAGIWRGRRGGISDGNGEHNRARAFLPRKRTRLPQEGISRT